MEATCRLNLAESIEQALTRLSFEDVKKEYWEQNEFVVIKGFLPRDIVQQAFVHQVERLRPGLNRNFVPGRKKGGSVSYFTIKKQAPEFLELYQSGHLLNFLSRLSDAPLKLCPETDPHSCALYYYTEPGDYIGFHYDTSYYRGARYTVLMGLIDQSPQCELVCQLYKDDPHRDTKELRLLTEPGDLVVFNGDKLWHAVTPLGEGEYRVVLTLEYLTNQEMHPLKRLYSNLKDAFAYFGIRTLLKGGR